MHAHTNFTHSETTGCQLPHAIAYSPTLGRMCNAQFCLWLRTGWKTLGLDFY